MKKYSVQLASLILFSSIFASGMAIGMETDIYPVGSGIAEKEAIWLRTIGIRPEVIGAKDVPQLPSDVKKVILTKLLRLILDDSEKKPWLLMSQEKLEGIDALLAQYITGAPLAWYKSADNIDFIIKLIIAGANPNTKNYKGNTVLHLLIANLQDSWRLREEDFEVLKLKIKLLSRYGININAQNDVGNTVAHELMKPYVKSLDSIFDTSNFYDLIKFLVLLGLDMTSIRNDDQQTPIELGQKLVESAINKSTDNLSLIKKLHNWMGILLLIDKRTKNLYGRILWKAIENKVKQTTDPARVEGELTAIRQVLDYSEFMVKE